MSVYRLSHTDTAILREHATTAKERIALDRLEAFEGDSSDVERALAICVRTSNVRVAGALGEAAPDVAHRIGTQLSGAELPETAAVATALRVAIAMFDGALRRLENPPIVS